MQITPAEIAETLAMVSKQHLEDIRTITLGLTCAAAPIRWSQGPAWPEGRDG